LEKFFLEFGVQKRNYRSYIFEYGSIKNTFIYNCESNNCFIFSFKTRFLFFFQITNTFIVIHQKNINQKFNKKNRKKMRLNKITNKSTIA
jgi:hypothetical protein